MISASRLELNSHRQFFLVNIISLHTMTRSVFRFKKPRIFEIQFHINTKTF